MILYIAVSVKEIFRKEKSYVWPRPKKCPKCGGSRLWGHGYVMRYFEGFLEGIWIKRWRCRACGSVHTMRPKNFWRRFRYTVANVVKSLTKKIAAGKWDGHLRRQVQQYWWRGFGKQCRREGKIARSAFGVLKRMLTKQVIVATHSLKFFQNQNVGGMHFTAAG